MKRRIAAVGLTLIVALALGIRLHPMWAHPETRRGGLGAFNDSRLYMVTAVNLAGGNGFTALYEPVVTRGPGYPAFASVVLRLFAGGETMNSSAVDPHAFDAIRYAQAVVDALTCVAVFAITRVIWPSSFVPALLAALLAAVCPYTIYYTRALLRETVATSLLTWTMLFVTLAARDRRVCWGILAGAGSGLLALCTPQYLPLTALFAAVLIVVDRGARRAGTAVAGCMLVAWIAVIVPWTIRNWVTFDRFIPVSTGDLGFSLFQGTFESNTNWTGWNEIPDEVFASAEEKAAVLDERERFLTTVALGSIAATEPDRFFRTFALQRIAADPIGWFVLGVSRLPRLWFQFSIPMYADREASGVFFLCYFVFAVYALFAADADVRARMLPIALLFVYTNALYLPLHIEPRYSTPVIPSILSLAAIGAYLLARRTRPRRSTR